MPYDSDQNYGHELLFGSFIGPHAAAADEVVALAEISEQVGLDLLTFQDHPYQPTFLDTWTLLSYVAARTERIRLSANVLNLPLRSPAVLARAAASLDLLSHGRFELGIGAGAYWDAIAAMGGAKLTPGQAVEAFEEGIDVIRQIWAAGERGGVYGKGLQAGIHGAKRGPSPAHDISVWVGALKPRMLDLIGRVGDGWLPSYPYLDSPDVLRRGNQRIDAAAVAAGRDPRSIRRLANISPADATPETLAMLARKYGISAFILMSDDREEIVRFGSLVAPTVRDLVTSEREQASAAGSVVATTTDRGTTSPTGRTALGITPTPYDGVRLSSRQVWDESERPAAPTPTPGTTYTDRGRQIGQHFIGVHDYLRSELVDLRNIAAQVLTGELAPANARSALNEMTIRQNDWTLNAYCANYCTTVTQHHLIEDTSILPHLRSREPGLAPVLDRLSKEHVDIHHLLNEVDRAMVEFITDPAGGGPLLQKAVDVLTDALLSHLSYEERELIPSIARHGLAPGQL